MPANLTPQYKEAEERFKGAETTADKLTALEEMLAIIPKHKGTEKIQADIKSRIAKLKKSDEKPGSQSKRGIEYNVEKEGGGQVILVGPPNSGKSSLLAKITNAQPDIGEYPYTTHKPLPGMMEYEDIKIQIVDFPPISEEFTEPWMAAVVRNADAVILVIDMSSDSALDELETTLKVLEKYKVALYGWDREKPKPEAIPVTAKKTILAANKMDDPASFDNLDVVSEFYGDAFSIEMISTRTGKGLEELRNNVFRMLDIVRVYTKIPGKPADMKSPYVLPRGSTVEELAVTVHKDFAQKLRYAKIWSQSGQDGLMVSRDHILEDKDIIEFHV
ncbi:MAG: GTPase [Armatimonadota bacterium]